MGSLRARLTVAIVLTAVLSLVAAALLTFDLIRRYNAQYAVGQLETVARAVAEEAGDDLVLEPARFRQLRRVLQASGHFLVTIGPAGGMRAEGKKAEALAAAVDVRPVLAGSTERGFVDIRPFRFAYVAIPTHVARRAARPLVAGVIVGRDAGLSWDPILSRVLLGAGAATLVAAAVATVWARRLARPVKSVAAATARVAGGDLAVRVPVEGSDELAELSHSFNAMASALDEARRREGEFLSNVSHELRTPITAIRGYAEALDEGAVHDEAGRAEAVRVIKTETARLERLVTDVMDLARVGTSAFRLAISRADVGAVLQQAADAHRAEAAEAGVDIQLSAPRIECETDPGRVRQVVTNLLENAIRATPRGGTIRLAASEAPGWALIGVSDNGPGIAPEHVPHVFERSYLRNLTNADPGPAPAGLSPGSGLGLAIVRELVQALGGTIDVASEPGRGTTFRIALRR